jgi:hypothetical protein
VPPIIDIFLFSLIGLVVAFICRSDVKTTVIVSSVVVTLAGYGLQKFLDSAARTDLQLLRMITELSVFCAAGLIAPLLVLLLRKRLQGDS